VAHTAGLSTQNIHENFGAARRRQLKMTWWLQFKYQSKVETKMSSKTHTTHLRRANHRIYIWLNIC